MRALRGDARVALVLTLRADFYASLMESALWADLDGQLSRLDVSPLRGDKLRTAIEAPARALGVYFEPVLVERLLHDVADEPGALPLLQDTLLDLWHQRTRGLLRLAEYDAMSDGVQTGLAVTVARRANGALNDLSPGRREIARRVLLRLVQFGDGNGDDAPSTSAHRARDRRRRAGRHRRGDSPPGGPTPDHHQRWRRRGPIGASRPGSRGLAVGLAGAWRVDSLPKGRRTTSPRAGGQGGRVGEAVGVASRASWTPMSCARFAAGSATTRRAIWA